MNKRITLARVQVNIKERGKKTKNRFEETPLIHGQKDRNQVGVRDRRFHQKNKKTKKKIFLLLIAYIASELN